MKIDIEKKQNLETESLNSETESLNSETESLNSETESSSSSHRPLFSGTDGGALFDIGCQPFSDTGDPPVSPVSPIGSDSSSSSDWQRQLPYAYWLGTVEGLGNRTKRDLVAYAGSAKELYDMPLSELKGILEEKKLSRLKQAHVRDAGQCYAAFLKENAKENRTETVRFIPIGHPEYPPRLLHTQDPPFALYVIGRLPERDRPTVAVIGARECSEYGRYMARCCGAELARAGVQVVSGMARGIDGIAQRAALQENGSSFAVLGCGVDVCYPAQNRDLYERMKIQGGICSEYPLHTQAKAQLFPPRNRIISGLSDLVLIIEAREKSGTLITADMALEQGREVYVLPGRTTDSLSAGCNRLLAQGAGIFLSVDRMLKETGLIQVLVDGTTGKERTEKKEGTEEKKGKEEKACNQSETERDTQESHTRESHIGENGIQESGACKSAVLEDRQMAAVAAALDFYPQPLARLQERTGLKYRQLVFYLLRLCMEGKAKQVSADCYVRSR